MFQKLLPRPRPTDYHPESAPRETVAIVIPAPPTPVLTPEEQISLRHLHHYLPSYDKFLLVPRGSDIKIDGIQNCPLSPRYFGSALAHGRLLYSPRFYRLFASYKYIFIYHLDALVFRDELLYWCGTDVDYIGAPWIPCADTPWIKEPAVGNGGFTLMKVESCLRVLYNRHRSQPGSYWADRFAGQLAQLGSLVSRGRAAMPDYFRRPATQRLHRTLRRIERVKVNVRNNDRFWSLDARKYVPTFEIPDWQVALRFAFEASPRQCFELNNRRLPFGCHAWTRYDRDFWEPHLLSA